MSTRMPIPPDGAGICPATHMPGLVSEQAQLRAGCGAGRPVPRQLPPARTQPAQAGRDFRQCGTRAPGPGPGPASHEALLLEGTRQDLFPQICQPSLFKSFGPDQADVPWENEKTQYSEKISYDLDCFLGTNLIWATIP